LLHPTSLPGDGGETHGGTLGEHAYRFVDFLQSAGFSVWQTLPLGPVDHLGSPYQARSVCAGNPALINLRALQEEGWASAGDVSLAELREDFNQRASDGAREEFQNFCHEHAGWLPDYALFASIKQARQERPWWKWPEGLRERRPAALTKAQKDLEQRIQEVCFQQFLFFHQWQQLKEYANGKGVLLFGDMPLFVAEDSVDVWVNRNLFCLDEDGRPDVVAGVPPDYFSKTGQRWGNPLYDWAAMAADDYSWWVRRMRMQLQLFDMVRVDHFRGLQAYWEIPAKEKNAVNGQWVTAPGEALMERLFNDFGCLPLAAEDLGFITPEVYELRDRFALPGMKVLQFAFSGEADNPYLPHQHKPNSIVYTGTHDNDTLLGWADNLTRQQIDYLLHYLGAEREAIPAAVVRATLASVSRLAILPMQDVLGLGTEHRMNIPGKAEGNWDWGFEWSAVSEDTVERFRTMVELYGRVID